MIADGIEIAWDVGSEYLPINPKDIADVKSIIRTIEYWHQDKICVEYNASVESIRRTKRGTEVNLKYDPLNNPHLNYSDVYWGTSTIVFGADDTNGIAEWKHTDTKQGPGGETTWRKISSGLYKLGEKESFTRQKRKQDALRIALLTLDQHCQLTHENTKDALEAAHIISSKKLGAEVTGNAILLRADIHRLYDKGLIEIDPAGAVTYSKNLPDSYRRAILVSQLNPKTYERIKAALTEISRVEA